MSKHIALKIKKKMLHIFFNQFSVKHLIKWPEKFLKKLEVIVKKNQDAFLQAYFNYLRIHP